MYCITPGCQNKVNNYHSGLCRYCKVRVEHNQRGFMSLQGLTEEYLKVEKRKVEG